MVVVGGGKYYRQSQVLFDSVVQESAIKSQRIGYVRVSVLDDKNPRHQLEQVPVDKVFADKESGNETQRPELDSLLTFVRKGDTVVVDSMDRLARNLDELFHLVQKLTDRAVRIEFVKERLTFTGEGASMANLKLSVIAAFAEFERAVLREKIALAKQRGAYRGRKKLLSPERVSELRQRVNAGEKKSILAREFGISRETLYQYLKANQ